MSKVTVTKLDPSYTVARMSISSEQDSKPLYYDAENRQIPYIEVEEEYIPEYDYETRSIKHWWFRNESTMYRDIHTKVATFRSRNSFTKILISIVIVQFDKRIGRFFS